MLATIGAMTKPTKNACSGFIDLLVAIAARIIPVKAMRDPSERSIPPEIITIVSPIANTESIAMFFEMFDKFSCEKKIARTEERPIPQEIITSTRRTLASRAAKARRRKFSGRSTPARPKCRQSVRCAFALGCTWAT